MGFFNRFKKQQPTNQLPELCYDVAYFILPGYAHNEPARLIQRCLTEPEIAGAFYYVMACKRRKIEPGRSVLDQFRWHHGKLTDDLEYFVLQFPVPPSVDMSGMSMQQIMGGGGPVLAPYFSAVLRNIQSGQVDYFILGQSPMGGGTTLRSVGKDGGNYNLGPGPTPQLEAFLDVIRERCNSAD